jgi:threonine dehydratase
MAAGTATAIKLLRPDIKVIGVQPERANAYVSRAGRASRP